MHIRKSSLWKVPVFCVLAGIVAFYLMVFAGHFVLVTLPDGTITADVSRQFIVHGVIFVAALLLGGLVFFRGMSRLEIFASASIVVAYGILVTVIQGAFQLTTGPAIVVFMYLGRVFQWCGIVPQLLMKINTNPWFCSILEAFVPYLFILFGQRDRKRAN